MDQLKTLAEKAPQQPSFLETLKKPGMSYICEVKKGFPLQGADRNRNFRIWKLRKNTRQQVHLRSPASQSHF